MAESKYAKAILDEFKEKFPDGWINQLNWDDGGLKNDKLKQGVARILEFQTNLFINLAKLVLSGDQLVSETNSFDELLVLTAEDNAPVSKALKDRLRSRYSELINDTRDSINLVKYHRDITKERYEPQGRDVIVRAIPFKINRENRGENVNLLDDICQACWAEYLFSFNLDYISELLLLKEKLTSLKNGKPEAIATIIDVAINKLNLLISKLSVFSNNKRITYNFNFKEITISLPEDNQYAEDDFRSYFWDFMDVKRINSERILSWQEETHEEDINMWQIVFLMRYYVKVTKSREQIDNLIDIFEAQYEDTRKDKTENIINKYACMSGRNYMYNSRFSYFCESEKGYTYDQMKADLLKIERIQNETFIYNYHPYLKAIEFTKKAIQQSIARNESPEKLDEMMQSLNDCFKKFKKNIEWCKANQPYLMQLRYNFSTINDHGIDVFYPSSFCRPLKFQRLEEIVRENSSEIANLGYQVKHQQEKLELLEAKKKINNFEKRNLEIMSLVFTITTFLVGLLSIFIGNNGASITDKMQYVVALGVVLLLFVCLGYFVVSDVLKKYKPWIFGILTVVFIIFLFVYSCQSDSDTDKFSKSQTTQTQKTTKP